MLASMRLSVFRWLVTAISVWAVGALDAAPRATLTVDRVRTDAVEASGVTLRWSLDDRDTPPALQVRVENLRVPVLEQSLHDLQWDCPALPHQPGPVRCEGPLLVGGRPAGTLTLDVSAIAATLAWAQGRRRLGVDWQAARPAEVALPLQAIPVAWLRGFLANLWSQGRFTGGTLDGDVRIGFPDTGPFEVEAGLRGKDLAVESTDGRIAAAGVAATARIHWREAVAGDALAVDLAAHRGELLAGPVYVAIPDEGLRARVEMARSPGGAWRLPLLSWRDGEVLRVAGSGRLDAAGELSALRIEARSLDLARTSARYLGGWLAPAGFPDLVLGGEAKLGFAFDEQGLQEVDAVVHRVNAIDPRGRFSLAGLAGGLHWARQAAVPDSRLGWQAASLLGIGLDAGELTLSSHDGALAQRAPTRLAVLGGHLVLDRLRWQPGQGGSPLTMQMGLALEDLDLGSLSQRLGWPAFEGRIDGVLPNAVYRGNRIRFEGGLAMSVFGGEVRFSNVELERPFGIAPSLAADIRFQDIDLGPLTRVFGYGEISGRLDGRLRDLRLVDWQPVAFDARFLTDKTFTGPRRVSQRAVQDISDLAGTGLMAGLQAQALRLFDDFRYDRIGVGCVLKDNVCRMSGLRRRGEGFVIIRGRGVPRLDVIGYRRTVDWPTLIQRLKAVAEGDGLRIE